jgi:hypothetical protein
VSGCYCRAPNGCKQPRAWHSMHFQPLFMLTVNNFVNFPFKKNSRQKERQGKVKGKNEKRKIEGKNEK